MNHPDEKIIELLALGASEVEHRRKELQLHFNDCQGCREMYSRFVEFYRNVGILEQDSLIPAAPQSPRLLAQPGFIVPASGEISQASHGPRSVWRSVRRHPVRSAVGLAAALAVVTLVVLFRKAPVGIPASVRVNTTTQEMSAFDRDFNTLWSKPVLVTKDTSPMSSWGISLSWGIADLYGNQRSEVLETFLMPGDRAQVLRVIDGKGNIVEALYGRAESLRFRGRTYDEFFSYNAVKPIQTESGPINIIASYLGGHSPTAITRLDAHLSTLGNYWHFGNLRPLDTVDVNADGFREILCGGINQDTPDEIGYPVLVALPASAITGDVQSSATPGFGLPDAHETAYIRLPLTDINLAVDDGAHVASITHTATSIIVDAHSTFVKNNETYWYVVTYLFDHQLRPMQVKWDEHTRIIHAQLAGQGLVANKFDSTYTAALRDGIRVWDGKQWHSGPPYVNE